jgi:hypothetical protein
VEVPAADKLKDDEYVRKVLGVHDLSDKILDWGIEDDKKILEQLSPENRLFNPRPFELEAAVEPEAAATQRQPSRNPSGVWGSSRFDPYAVRKADGSKATGSKVNPYVLDHDD